MRQSLAYVIILNKIKNKVSLPCCDDQELSHGVQQLDLLSKLKPLEGGGRQGTMVSCFCFFVVMGCVFGVGMVVGFESPPLVSEDLKKYMCRVWYKT